MLTAPFATLVGKNFYSIMMIMSMTITVIGMMIHMMMMAMIYISLEIGCVHACAACSADAVGLYGCDLRLGLYGRVPVASSLWVSMPLC